MSQKSEYKRSQRVLNNQPSIDTMSIPHSQPNIFIFNKLKRCYYKISVYRLHDFLFLDQLKKG